MTIERTREPSRKDVRDMINVICAAILFISPWALGFAAETRAAWTAWSGGVVIGAMAIAALLEFAEWEEWVALLVGAAVAASPWVLGFATIHHAAIVFAALEIVVALSSISEIWTVHFHSGAAAKL